MKKLFMVVGAVALLLGGSMTVRAARTYDQTIDGVQCYGSIIGDYEVMAFTACGSTSTTVIIRSTAYDESGKAVGSGGNAGGGYASTRYAASGIIASAIQDHEVPSYGFSKTLMVHVY